MDRLQIEAELTAIAMTRALVSFVELADDVAYEEALGEQISRLAHRYDQENMISVPAYALAHLCHGFDGLVRGALSHELLDAGPAGVTPDATREFLVKVERVFLDTGQPLIYQAWRLARTYEVRGSGP